MKTGELYRLNLKTIRREPKIWRPFIQILFCAGFLICTLLSFKTAYFRLNELASGNLTGNCDAIYYFSDPSQLREGLDLEEDDQFDIQFLWARTGKTQQKNPVDVISYQDFDSVPFRLIQGKLPQSQSEVLICESWGLRNSVQPGDTVEITDPEGNNPSSVTVSGIYESTTPQENLISLLEKDSLESEQIQGQIALKKGKNFQPQILENPPSGLILNDFTEDLSDQKDGLVRFAIPFIVILMLCFSAFILVYGRILVQHRKNLMDQMHILGLSAKDRKRIRVMDYFLIPLCALSTGAITSAVFCSVLLNERNVQVIFPAYRILEGQYNWFCSLSFTDGLMMLLFVAAASAITLAAASYGSESAGIRNSFQFRKDQLQIPGYRKSLHRIYGRGLLLLLIVLLQILWQFSSQSFLSWISRSHQDSQKENLITVQLMSQNLTVDDLSYLESLYDQFDEAQQITVSLDLNTMLRETPLMAIPDEDYQMLLNRESSCTAGENLYISQDPGFAQAQTVQIEKPVSIGSEPIEISACIVDDYGRYQTENSGSEILTSFSVAKNWLAQNENQNKEDQSGWSTAATLIIDSADPSFTVEKIEQNPDLYDRFQVSLINSSAALKRQKTRELILSTSGLAAAVMILFCALYTFCLIQKGSLEKYRKDFEIYYSLGLPDRVLKRELLLENGNTYLMGSAISIGILLLVHPAWLNFSWFVFLAVFFGMNMLSVWSALCSFWKKN